MINPITYSPDEVVGHVAMGRGCRGSALAPLQAPAGLIQPSSSGRSSGSAKMRIPECGGNHCVSEEALEGGGRFQPRHYDEGAASCAGARSSSVLRCFNLTSRDPKPRFLPLFWRQLWYGVRRLKIATSSLSPSGLMAGLVQPILNVKWFQVLHNYFLHSSETEMHPHLEISTWPVLLLGMPSPCHRSARPRVISPSLPLQVAQRGRRAVCWQLEFAGALRVSTA